MIDTRSPRQQQLDSRRKRALDETMIPVTLEYRGYSLDEIEEELKSEARHASDEEPPQSNRSGYQRNRQVKKES